MHYTDYHSFHSSIVAFSQYARANGLQIGLQETIDAAKTSLQGFWLQDPWFKNGLQGLCCRSTEDIVVFERVYQQFWQPKGSRVTDLTFYKNEKRLIRSSKNTAVMLGHGQSKHETRNNEARTSSGANATENLRHMDFSVLSAIDGERMDEIIQQLVKEMKLRLKRRRKSARKGQISMAQTLRKNLQHGGHLIELTYRQKRKDRFRLLVLLDISGSMDKYSYYLLRFIWALRSEFKHVEVFAFSTRLMRITDFLADSRLEDVMAMVGQKVTHWSSGTKIGESFASFNQLYSKRYLNGKTLSIVLSDGLDTGETNKMEEELLKIKMRSKLLIWLNPLKGMASYQPVQRGMKAAMPYIDHFNSAHNLQSLLNLEKILMDA